ncbi:ABC transporter permease [Cupriavidus basilensis OR16]|uniref:ABC transporter permease n=1 Tax=Cupriavidus basilensis OR16 TaxID=1127483 RepID=H1S124_9BURK|nr:PhnD/SsuA/transferrin family substrate-binding protein [Cupriavidus basilensis]EHP43840.1 ABC transporter permease [Cupriavidus basilensis OR16]
MIANARMYAVAAPVGQVWRALLTYVGERAGVAWAYVEHAAPAPLSALWARPDCGCVFMCGFPFVSAGSRHRLLAAPVPSLPRYADRPAYFTEFIVRDDAAFTTLEAAFGGRLACMLPESNSGYNAPRHYLMAKAAASAGTLFRPTAAPTPTPRQVIDAVIRGEAEVGVVDSYVLDLLRMHAPALMAQVRTVAVTPASPIPPLVASPLTDDDTVVRVRAVLLDLHLDPACTGWLAQLRLARFAQVSAQDYDVLACYASEADQAGFTLTGARGAKESRA